MEMAEEEIQEKILCVQLSSIMASIIYMAARYVETGHSDQNKTQCLTDRVLEYIHQNFNQPISNIQIAAKVGFSSLPSVQVFWDFCSSPLLRAQEEI